MVQNKVLLLLLLPTLAFAAPPRMDRVKEGYVFPEDGWALNEEGKQKLQLVLDKQTEELVNLRTQNASLQNSLKEMEAKPALTFKGGAVLVGVGLVVGLLTGIAVGVLVKR